MPSEDLKKRIEALNKGPLQNVPSPKQVLSPQSEDSPKKPPARSRKFRVVESANTLHKAVHGIVTSAPVGPDYYHVEKPASDLESGVDLLHRDFMQLMGDQDVLFMDLETTGLNNTPLFLIGVMECCPECFVFKQYFARDYSEEISILSAFSERLKSSGMLITFNGKSFDLPFLQRRAAFHGIRLPGIQSHRDLLHEARKIYSGRLPNCRLQTLEAHICGRDRTDDIPGSEIPKAYHDFVDTGNADKISLILRHNLFDLLTMADLMLKMTTA